MAEEKKTRNRTETCGICRAKVSRRKSVDVPSLGRVCRTHTVRCRICGTQVSYAEAVEVEWPGANPLDLNLFVCRHHYGVRIVEVPKEEEKESDETEQEA